MPFTYLNKAVNKCPSYFRHTVAWLHQNKMFEVLRSTIFTWPQPFSLGPNYFHLAPTIFIALSMFSTIFTWFQLFQLVDQYSAAYLHLKSLLKHNAHLSEVLFSSFHIQSAHWLSQFQLSQQLIVTITFNSTNWWFRVLMEVDQIKEREPTPIIIQTNPTNTPHSPK